MIDVFIGFLVGFFVGGFSGIVLVVLVANFEEEE
jgi:hypothetical protein